MTTSFSSPKLVKDVFLNPGELYFGGPDYRVRTLLGSCVSIILWHPKLHIGGMCHYLLATKGDRKVEPGLEGKYGEDAFQILLQSSKSHFAPINEYVAKIFGGSNMFSKTERTLMEEKYISNSKLVGIRNVEFAKDILNQHSIKIISENTGGTASRKVFFTIWDGEVWLETHQE
ncbi:MAG: chemotaxis protein CheD [Leptospira sp.]|jgi:chemotaxis protein CheD|nr:chemotaxis protein CheD [Leptospira sp.]